MKLNRKLAIAGAAVLAVGALGFGTAEAAVTVSPVHHAAFFACISHNGAGSATSVAGRPVTCPAGSILAEGDKGTMGPAGKQGPAGPKGDSGPAGPAGTAGDVLHNSFGATAAANGFTLVAATCAGTAGDGVTGTPAYAVGGDAANGPADGYVAVGGGYSVGKGSGDTAGVNVTMSRDELTYTAGRGWLVTFDNTTDVPVTVRTWVICVSAPADQAAT